MSDGQDPAPDQEDSAPARSRSPISLRPLIYITGTLAVLALLTPLLQTLSSDDAAPGDDPGESSLTDETDRKVTGDFRYQEDWCQDLDFEELGSHLDELDIEGSEVDETYVPDHSPPPDQDPPDDQRMFSRCVVTNTLNPLSVVLGWNTQVLPSPAEAATQLEHWSNPGAEPGDEEPSEIEGWAGSRLHFTSNETSSETWMTGRDSNLIIVIAAKDCSTKSEDGSTQPCDEQALQTLVPAIGEQAKEQLAASG